MFQKINLSFDCKDLEIIKNALENEIDALNNQVFVDEYDKEVISEHKKLLNIIKIILGDI